MHAHIHPRGLLVLNTRMREQWIPGIIFHIFMVGGTLLFQTYTPLQPLKFNQSNPILQALSFRVGEAWVRG